MSGSVPIRRIPEPVRMVLSLFLDYLRWVSLTPMVVVWAFYLFTILFMLFVNFQDPILDGLERGYESYRESYGPVAWIEGDPSAVEQEEGAEERPEQAASEEEPSTNEAVEFDGSDIIPWIMRAWGIIALAAWVLSLLRGLIFGPRPPRTMARKRRILYIAVLVGWVLLFVAYFFGNTAYQGGFLQWFVMFTVFAVVVTLVSLPTLMLGQVFDMARDQLLPDRAPH